jgi:ribosomal-protein-alanine acetyltransferase
LRKSRQKLKNLIFRILGKDPEAVVVSFFTAEESLAVAMAEEIRRLVPDRRHYVVNFSPGSSWRLYCELRRKFRRLRIGQAAVLFTSDRSFAPLRRAAFMLAPGRILAYNARLERHHLRLRTLIASWLFLRGVPLDRIFLRPWWLYPWKKDRTTIPSSYKMLEGRPLSSERRRVAVLSPYFPYPLSHGGAVRIFHLLREAASEFDIFLFAFTEGAGVEEYGPLLEICTRVILVAKPRYREPCWSSIEPPEVCEYRSPVMQHLLEQIRREYEIKLLQVEYTQLAFYGGDILVEHDVTFDLYRQEWSRKRSLSALSDYVRWRRFEQRAVRRYRCVVAMSDKDVGMLAAPCCRVLPNGVDLDRFQPQPEEAGWHLLFVGSFRHFPNIVAFRFFTEQVWPLLRERFPSMTVTVIAGPDPLVYWRASQNTAAPLIDGRVQLLEFVRDVRPFYAQANIVIVPTLVSAGTNLKVLEAMAVERAIVSTSSGCAGLGLEHGKDVWIADTPAGFAYGVARLVTDDVLRRNLAAEARRHAERCFGWKQLGEQQRALWSELLTPRLLVRKASYSDLAEIDRIQQSSPEAAHWNPQSYLSYDCFVADLDGNVAGFVTSRRVSQDEVEILNLAVVPEARRGGVATALLRETFARHSGGFFLEVRQSNLGARQLYKKLGFQEVGLRHNYYKTPPEDGIVMRLQSW